MHTQWCDVCGVMAVVWFLRWSHIKLANISLALYNSFLVAAQHSYSMDHVGTSLSHQNTSHNSISASLFSQERQMTAEWMHCHNCVIPPSKHDTIERRLISTHLSVMTGVNQEFVWSWSLVDHMHNKKSVTKQTSKLGTKYV